ncbi:bifunctional biotin carboxylase/biotin carboxyl carrier protein [Acinetobacter haemolyticus]|nr:hypothetical protein F927_02257 [Acinetobacter haemolyticus CIP 64.3 = MTCC 9819]SPT48524.1 bifunctional biotin carboxylase/biotin carboxyl carrier protein [Acinetobacter haemolyticus]SUU61021.1 bifunctional biotin carboxylase/biotin carboxyl carrier protein [Acinetobacter haemolyticus]
MENKHSPDVHNNVKQVSKNEKAVLAPINGVISAWKIKENDQVQQGDVIAMMEAMKMEVPVIAHCTGRIQHLRGINLTINADEEIARIEG